MLSFYPLTLRFPRAHHTIDSLLHCFTYVTSEFDRCYGSTLIFASCVMLRSLGFLQVIFLFEDILPSWMLRRLTGNSAKGKFSAHNQCTAPTRAWRLPYLAGDARPHSFRLQARPGPKHSQNTRRGEGRGSRLESVRRSRELPIYAQRRRQQVRAGMAEGGSEARGWGWGGR